jgi:RNA polymerase sigma factor (TIGR02999 family)
MTSRPPSDLTRLLRASSAGDAGSAAATSRLVEVVYDELRALAAGIMRRERSDHTLQPTALVHEAFVRLVDQTGIVWQDRAHFFGIAARTMRQVLVDHARKRHAARRGGGWQRVTLDDAVPPADADACHVIDLHQALERFSALDARAAQVAELKVFGGLTNEEVGHVLEVSPRTVVNDWSMARMWLGRELSAGSPP